MNNGPQDYLDPKVLQQVSRLELKARLIVEGFISGLHKSPYHGSSVEFAEHREYVPGDDVRHIDWKVFGRSDRIYIKRFEEETNLQCYFLVDASESMAYPLAPEEVGKVPGVVSKFEYATYLAAALAYLALRQQDAVGLSLFDDQVRNYVDPSSTPSHLSAVLETLGNPSMGKKTDIGTIFHEFAERLKKKSLVIIISDMLDALERVQTGLEHLRYRNHDVIVFHVLDHEELTFPFSRMTLFEGMEESPELLADPHSLRKAYLQELDTFMEGVRKICRNALIDYVQIDTQERLNVALSSYLSMRMGALRS